MTSIPATMRAARLTSFNAPYTLEEATPVPENAANEVLVRVGASSLCYTDIPVQGGMFQVLDIIPGHEGAGTVVKVGAAVTTLKLGDRVVFPPSKHSCLSCKECVHGYDNFCPTRMLCGTLHDGPMSEYTVADPLVAFKIPDSMSFAEACSLGCAGVTSWNAIQELRLKVGQTFAVIGGGGLGLMAVQFGVALGLKVVLVDIDDAKLASGKEQGAHILVNSKTDPEAAKTIIKATNGGVDGVVVVVGHPSAYELGQAIMGSHATLSVVGLVAELNVSAGKMFGADSTIRFINTGGRALLADCVTFAADHGIKPKIELGTLDGLNDAVLRMKAGRQMARYVVEF